MERVGQPRANSRSGGRQLAPVAELFGPQPHSGSRADPTDQLTDWLPGRPGAASPTLLIVMGNWLIERRLTKVGSRLKSLRSELAVIDEQLLYLADDADDQAIRAMVAETASSSFEARAAQGSFANMTKHRIKVVAEMAELEQRQDDLLDQMVR